MKKTYIVCHMLTSINGKISGSFLNSPLTKTATQAYERINKDYKGQAWLCGRVTMEENFTNFRKPDLKENNEMFPREDYIAVEEADLYIVSADPAGKVGWTTNYVSYESRPQAHIIEILTHRASNAYLAFLREKKISYLFAGENLLDCKLAVEKLRTLFKIDTLLVSGGGFINYSFLQEGLIDEISLVMAPVTEGEHETNTIFEKGKDLSKIEPVGFKLKEVEILEENTLCLRYLKD